MMSEEKKESSGLIQFLFVVQIIYFTLAIGYSYRAYSYFKYLFFTQLGQYGQDERFRRMDDSSSDDEHGRDDEYQRQQR